MNGLCVALVRLKVTSRRSTCFRFVLISILNPISLNILMSFLDLSVCFPFAFLRIISPSSPYNAVSFLYSLAKF